MIVMQCSVQGMTTLLELMMQFYAVVQIIFFLDCRCCEYALLILEHWPNAPEIQRSGDLYEDFIRCCVADAMSEIINEEDGGMHRRHASPSLRDRGGKMSFTSHASASSNLRGYRTSTMVAMDRSSSLFSGTSLSSGLLLSQTKSLDKGSECSLESVLHASKQKATAIESMLRGQLSCSTKFQMLLRRQHLMGNLHVFCFQLVLKQKKQANVPSLGFGALVSPAREVLPIYVLLSR
ncbi:hypothetical protein Pint_26997 [Pistacia integerrima]|uniref:Uncharacterized protein n=1 Tax=Pistacia integerrima TaxID=434235 RepID=A0ACC0YR40_9ROSI|nr:hypothetical protein Pint_26997 [Pistacia integerrima]